MMQNKLIQFIPGFAKFDQFLLLNFPRLWLSRAHVVVSTAAIVFVALLVLTLGVIRPALVPSYTTMLVGERGYECLGKTLMREQAECAIQYGYRSLNDSISTSLILMDIIFSIIGALLALLWIRAQSRYSIEAVHGKVHWYSAWGEWACYALCLGLIFGGGWVVRIGLTPSPTQMHSFDATMENTYPRMWNYQVPSDLNFVVRRVVSSSAGGVDLMALEVTPGSAEARHLQQLADTAYAAALGAKPTTQDPGNYYGDEMPDFLQALPWMLIVGYGAYLIYVSKRQKWVHIFAAFLLSNILVIVAFFLVVFILGVILSGLQGQGGENIMLGLLLGGLTVGLVVAGLQWVRALTLKRFSLNAALGTIAFPWVLAYAPIIFIAVSSASWVQAWLGWEWQPQQRSNAAVLAIAIAPYLFLPIMPLLDKALVRLSALPTER